MAGVFQFKQFAVDQTGCAMKINTDGVLLGAMADGSNPGFILDIGTGTGVIAMMLAQRFADARIDAVEIDESAATTAADNFVKSPFAGRLTLHQDSFEAFFDAHPDNRYDIIVSNPPFYINSLRSPGAGKDLAKHADADFFEKLVSGVARHLTGTGLFWLILPLDTAELVKRKASEHSLYIQQVISILSYPDSDPHREILVFGFGQTETHYSTFVIYDAPKQYSAQYRTVLHDFFTIFP